MLENLPEISGHEKHGDSGDPLNALIDFYRAFNGRDLAALASNWAEGDRPSMDNPIGGICRGWQAIRERYRKLFEGPARVRVAFHDFTTEMGDDWFEEPHLLAEYQRLIFGAPLPQSSSDAIS
jgi:hypothetical protein